MRTLRLALLVMTVGLAGCPATGALMNQPASHDTAQLMDLWRIFTHCRSSTDPDEMRNDAQRLDRAAHVITRHMRASFVVLDAMPSALPKPSSRLAVDPTALAVACTLYAGQAAQSLGQVLLATEMFRSLLATGSDREYAYYVRQASRGLEQMEQTARFSMDTSQQAPDIFSR